MTLPAQSGVKDSVRLLLTKTPPAPSVTLGARSTVSRLNGSRSLGRQLARDRAPTSVLTLAWSFIKRWGPLTGLRRLWCACTVVWWTDASLKWDSTTRARKPLCPSWSRISLWTCQAWVALPHSSKDHWNAQALSQRQRSQSVWTN